jgi:DNA-binding LytR/AlgR family response regulator
MNNLHSNRILIVEDDMIIAANLSMHLTSLGYEVTGIESRGEEALVHSKVNPPEVILMDIQLKGQIDGIETAKLIQQEMNIPIIFLTANSDDATFAKAKATNPYAFISKPFNKLDLERTIALAMQHHQMYQPAPVIREAEPEMLGDRFFVRFNGKLVKILIAHIQYIEADRNYCHIYTESGNYLVVSPLKTIEEKLQSRDFVRVHRSFMVNINRLDAVGEEFVEVSKKSIPVSKSYKDILMSRIQTL